MVNYTLTVESAPTGIQMKVEALSQSFWRVTNFSESFESGTVVTIIAPQTIGEPQGTAETCFYFKKWEDGSLNPRREHTLVADKTITATYEQQKYFPTRPPLRRGQKFEAKADEEVGAIRIGALKNMMVEQQEVTTAQQERIELLVGNYLNNQGLYGMNLHHYRNFSQELYGLSRLFKGATLNKEAQLKADKWLIRLTDTQNPAQTVKQRLESIAKLFNITLTWT